MKARLPITLTEQIICSLPTLKVKQTNLADKWHTTDKQIMFCDGKCLWFKNITQSLTKKHI